MNEKDLAIIMCPPLSDYPEPPDDQPNCKLLECPKCKNKMWISGKKQGLLVFMAISKLHDITLACYSCIEKEAKAGSINFNEFEQINI